MKTISFADTQEILEDSIIQSLSEQYKFTKLINLLPPGLQLTPLEQFFCDETYLLANSLKVRIDVEQDNQSFYSFLEEIIRGLLAYKKSRYVQCVGLDYQNHKLSMNLMNFSKTIIEQSGFKTLFNKVPKQQLADLLINFIVIVRYKGQYIQVAGQLLNEKFCLKAIGEKKSKNFNKKNISNPKKKEQNKSKSKTKEQMPNQKPKNIYKYLFRHDRTRFNYVDEKINRFQMFYNNQINRKSGIFCKNIFFDKGLVKSTYPREAEIRVNSYLQKNVYNKIEMNEEIKLQCKQYFIEIFQNFRNLLEFREYRGENTSKFVCLLGAHCPIAQNHQELKKKVKKYIEQKQSRDSKESEEIFNSLYANDSNYNQVYGLIKQILKRVPSDFIGRDNLKLLIRKMKSFISMKRYENYKMMDILFEMDVFQVQWIQIPFHPKYKNQIIARGRQFLGIFISFIINEIVVIILKSNFYVTEKHKEANKIFYYRKHVWALVSQMAIAKFGQDNLEMIEPSKVLSLKRQNEGVYPEGKLRILPKKGTFRPIITFNRKFDVAMRVNNPIRVGESTVVNVKLNLNQYLADTQLVLRNMKNILGERYGYCIFDNRQISKRYDKFIQKWREAGSKELKYFTLDIKKCYDSINPSLLLQIIKNTDLIEDDYFIIKYNRLYRNKRPLYPESTFSGLYNYKERVRAIPFSEDLIEIKQEHRLPSINIYPGKQRIVTKTKIMKQLKQICQGSIISYKKNNWLQKVGIPQGLNVSGVLCSLYFAKMEKQMINVQDGLLMRLTDDYLYIGPEEEAVKVLDSLLDMAEKYKFQFSEDKISKNFDHPRLKNKKDSKEILWIGKKINIETLEMSPFFEESTKLSYAMNVNINKKSMKPFLRNKFKSLLTNHFASYFKPRLFEFESLKVNIRLYVKISLEKYMPFLTYIQHKKIEKQRQVLDQLYITLFKSTIHQYVVYVCMLADNEGGRLLYDKIYKEVADQIASFFQRKSHYGEFKLLKKIFRKNADDLNSKILKGQGLPQELQPSEF